MLQDRRQREERLNELVDGSIRAGTPESTQVEPAPFLIRTTGLSSSGTELDKDKEEESGGRDDRRRGTRRKKRREESFFPADPLARLPRPPRLLPLRAARWPGRAQTALLPVPILVPLAFQTGRLRRREERRGAAVSDRPARCHLRGEGRRARRAAAAR